MGKKKISIVILAPAVINVSDAPERVCPDLDCGVYEDGFNLDMAEDLQNEIMPDKVLEAAVLRSKLKKAEWGLLCVHPNVLLYQDCMCYNSEFCRKECEFRNIK